MKKEMDFGVFYTCFTEYDSVNYSLEELYKIYPNIPVFLVSDGGADYSELEKKFSGLKTSLENDSRGLVPKVNYQNFLQEDTQKYMKDSIFTFMDRIERAIRYCKKDYLLIMEPDVLVRGKLHIDENDHLLGSRVNHYHWAKDQINEVLSKIPGSANVSHYGATPAIFKCETFLKIHKFFKENENYIEDFCKIDPCFPNYDILITVIFSAFGYPEVVNTELTECLRNPHWRDSNHPLLHQFREFYPTNNYNGRHSSNWQY